MCDYVDVQMCTDDTVIHTHGKDIEQLAAKLSVVMEKIAINGWVTFAWR